MIRRIFLEEEEQVKEEECKKSKSGRSLFSVPPLQLVKKAVGQKVKKAKSSKNSKFSKCSKSLKFSKF
jgi:hypothetical protein